jgi:hypothetical protein
MNEDFDAKNLVSFEISVPSFEINLVTFEMNFY